VVRKGAATGQHFYGEEDPSTSYLRRLGEGSLVHLLLVPRNQCNARGEKAQQSNPSEGHESGCG
jgi:hypothetical protein